MVIKYCDGDGMVRPCPTPDECKISCEYDFGNTRKVRPYPEVPPDVYSAQKEFDSLMAKLGWVIGAFLVVIFANLLFALYILLRML